MDIKEKIKTLPQSSGVYLMKDKDKHVIYVGKAANLKNRVYSYFSKTLPTHKNQLLINEISDIEIVPTSSEHEAFLLESDLIKKFNPRYNISLKDDKSFPFIKITKDDYPRVFIGRKKPHENVEYHGPYTNAKLLRLALKSIRKVFGFCSCRRFPKKECFYYHLGLCPAPCTRKISKEEYRKNIKDLKHFLKKGSRSLIKELEEKMHYYTKLNEFEEAIKLRDRIKSLELLTEQNISANFSILGLDREPYRIEAFDISDLFGKEAVGSMVTFVGGSPHKDDYRRFKIKTVEGIDDYKMLEEVLSRRYNRVKHQNLERPDLIIIDGGRGHLGIAYRKLKDLGLDITIIAIAKEKDLIYTVTKSSPIKLNIEDKVLHLIQRVRDEAHRFAIKYHHLLRKKKMLE